MGNVEVQPSLAVDCHFLANWLQNSNPANNLVKFYVSSNDHERQLVNSYIAFQSPHSLASIDCDLPISF